MHTLKPLVLCLGVTLAAGLAHAQQPSVDEIRRQVDSAAAQSPSAEAEAAQKRLNDAVEQARISSGIGSAPSETPAKSEAAAASSAPSGAGTRPGVTASGTLPSMRNPSGSASSTSATSTSTSSPTATAAPVNLGAGVQRIHIPPASGVGVKAPFAHDYFARFEGRSKPPGQPLLEGVSLRGAVTAESLQQQIDADLERDRQGLDLRNVEAAPAATARSKARERHPFGEPGAQQLASSSKPQRAPRRPFEELN